MTMKRYTTRYMLLALTALGLISSNASAAWQRPELEVAAPNVISYEIYDLGAARTPASNLLCDAGGSVFFGEETKNVAPGYLGRIDPSGNVTEWEYGWAPISMVRSGADELWTADFESTTLDRLNIASNELVSWDAGITVMHGIGARDGAVWSTSRTGKIVRLIPATGLLTVWSLPGGGELKHSMLDSRGRLWISGGNLAGAGAAVFSLDTTSLVFTRYALPNAFNPWGIREAVDGAIWFSDFNGKTTQSGNVLGRLDPATRSWLAYPGLAGINYVTSFDFAASGIWGIDILSDAMFILEPEKASASNSILSVATSTASKLEERTLSPTSRTLTPIRRKLTPIQATTNGVSAGGFTTYSIPNAVRVHSLFGMRICDAHAWISGLYADQLYHIVQGSPATATPTRTMTPTATPTRRPSATPTATQRASATATPTRRPSATPTATLRASATATPTRRPSATPTATRSTTGGNLLAGAAFKFSGTSGVSGYDAGGIFTLTVQTAGADGCWFTDLPATSLRGRTLFYQAAMRKTADMGAYAPYISLQARKLDGTMVYNYGGIIQSRSTPGGPWVTDGRSVSIGQDVDMLRAAFCVWRAGPGAASATNIDLR